MNKKRYLILFLIIVLITVFVTSALLLLKNNASNNATLKDSNKTNQETMKILNSTQKIILTTSGFEPKKVTISTGTRILWTNLSGDKGTVNSDPYPTNGLWNFLNLGLFNNNESVSLTFDKAGTYTYHNQLKPEQTGTIIVN